MNPRRACLSVLLGSIVIAASASATVALAADPAAHEDDPQSVLFIGNSHTEWNGGLDWLIENFVAAEGDDRPFAATAMTSGGVTLAYHWNNGAPDEVRSGKYDTVVLQGYLAGAETSTIEPFLENARLLDDVIESSGADTVFFMTWPNGVHDWSTIDDAVKAHRLIEEELGATVAPAALAFERARAERPELELIGPDRVHATWEGGYLAAATVYATLFGRSPEGLPYSFGVDPDTAAFLQRIAWETVTAWNEDRAAYSSRSTRSPL